MVAVEEYIERLENCGLRLDDASVLVNDFLRDWDWDGLAEYVNDLEALHGRYPDVG